MKVGQWQRSKGWPKAAGHVKAWWTVLLALVTQAEPSSPQAGDNRAGRQLPAGVPRVQLESQEENWKARRSQEDKHWTVHGG